MVEILTFEQALDCANQKPSNKHLLLGNGFSIACRSDIFLYGRLFERANFDKNSPKIPEVFQTLDTTDFEKVIQALRNLSNLIPLYIDNQENIVQQIRSEAEEVKEILVQTIASSHPERPSDIANDEYASCRQFLSNFNKIYTLNYDLLLYWTIMQEEIEPSLNKLDDAFRASRDNPEAEYVTFEPDQGNNQTIIYLHGALHLFDAGYELQKYTWINTGVALIDQIRFALDNNLFPLFVAEGNSQDKLNKIGHNAYLARAYRSFSQIGGVLFIYGHSLAENDDHIINLIKRGKTSHLFISIYGDQHKTSNQDIIKKALWIKEIRDQGKNQLQVHFYDAESARVWN